ncbi:hypothetical protein ACN20G_33310 (plasmid) [Streptomyces sp. BI20]|uniref:hypothetical protein n=1 Tax=Streptomyces sp. BI20 TaxID=3403460 RepID=UPI003C71D608
MTILRRHLSTGYTVLPTATIDDTRLSFRARGILVYLLAKPDDWAVSGERIARAGKEGVEAVRTAMRELRKLGYYRVVRERAKAGTWTSITEVYDTAQPWAAEEFRESEAKRLARRRAKVEVDQTTEPGFPGVGSPGVGSPEGGESGGQTSTHTNNPPTPAAEAPGASASPVEQAPVGAGSTGCVAHPDRPGRRCRACGTTERQARRAQADEARQAREARQRARDAQVLAEGAQPVSELSEAASAAIATIRATQKATRGQRRKN